MVFGPCGEFPLKIFDLVTMSNSPDGKLEVRAFFTSDLMGCEPDPCDCIPNDEGWCQVFPSMASVGAEVAIGTLDFPTDKMVEVVVQ